MLRPAIGTALLVLGAAMPPAVFAQAPAATTANAPLGLQATCDASVPTPVMRVQITNRSDRTTPVVLGFTATGGKAQVVNSVLVIAIRPATGAEEPYVYVNAKFALATGPAWVVSLAPGATHDLELPLKDFISTTTYNSLDASVAGGTRLVFEARQPGGRGTSPWTGKIETVLERCRQ